MSDSEWANGKEIRKGNERESDSERENKLKIRWARER